MTIFTTADVVTLDAHVVRVRTAVAPPFRWTEQSDNGSASRDCQVRRPGITTNINLRLFCQRMESFQRKRNCSRFAGSGGGYNSTCQRILTGSMSHQRMQAKMIPQLVCQCAKVFGAPKL